jgi:hypothetical protein
MFKRLATLLKRKPARSPAPEAEEDLADDIAPIFEGLAMTEELRDALFPKTPQMISAIFDRPAPLQRPSPGSAPAYSPASSSGDFPIIL